MLVNLRFIILRYFIFCALLSCSVLKVLFYFWRLFCLLCPTFPQFSSIFRIVMFIVWLNILKGIILFIRKHCLVTYSFFSSRWPRVWLSFLSANSAVWSFCWQFSLRTMSVHPTATVQPSTCAAYLTFILENEERSKCLQYLQQHSWHILRFIVLTLF